MKTQMNITNLKMAVTFTVALVLMTGSFANARESRKEERISLNRLTEMMEKTEASIRYNAPTVEEAEEFTAAMVRLENLAVVTESSVRYEAPAAVEIAYEIESLEALAGELEAGLQYKAPMDEAVEEITGENDAHLLAEIK